MTTGDEITCSKAFTTPTGVTFVPGDVFVVDLVGSINVRCYAKRCGTVVWVADGWFLAGH